MQQNNSNEAPVIFTDEHPRKPTWRQLFKMTEGRILLLGIASALAGLIVMGLIAFWSPQTSRMMGAMIFTDMAFGMIVSMSVGYANGFGHALVIPVVMWVETVLVLLLYPLFVFSLLKLVEFPRLKYFLDRIHVAAERNHDRVRRYGVPGLFLFVWFPFWMTGPVLGSAVGYLLGFPASLTLSVVLAGAYVTIIGWAYLLFDLYIRAAVFGSWAPILIIGMIILVTLAVYLLGRRRKNHR